MKKFIKFYGAIMSKSGGGGGGGGSCPPLPPFSYTTAVILEKGLQNDDLAFLNEGSTK